MSPLIEFQPPHDVRVALENFGVTDLSIERLVRYVSVLDRWRQRINLIGPANLNDIWTRHVLDSAQVFPLLGESPGSSALVDFGSGAGFPGLVLSCISGLPITLVDSDQRKAVFLREAARHAGVDVRVIPERFDKALKNEAFGKFQFVTGRAVAPLARLLPFIYGSLEPAGFALMHKGARVEKELTEAMKSWTMKYEMIPSITSDDGIILKIWCLRPNDANKH
ncbi:MAG: 16S rRNA (guanine(527)-N(7))-methyltransferase RsmG [Rhodospirillales bacterium]